MSHRELYCSKSLNFGGFTEKYAEAKYIVLGAPFDYTCTFRAGARFAPSEIRKASANIETYSFSADIDLEEIEIFDLGDIHVSGEIGEMLKRIELVVSEVASDRKLPIIIGGEHTLTLGAVRAFKGNVGLVSLDAHFDLRNEYLGLKTSHATFMRRICEEIGPENILIVGVRAACREEIKYVRKSHLKFVSMEDLRRQRLQDISREIEEFMEPYDKVYLTIDMDVLDPSVAPAVQNPEPDGLTMNQALSLLEAVCRGRVAALDVVEAAPPYDYGVTSICAAKMIFEAICQIERSRRERS